MGFRTVDLGHHFDLALNGGLQVLYGGRAFSFLNEDSYLFQFDSRYRNKEISQKFVFSPEMHIYLRKALNLISRIVLGLH